MKTSLHKEGRKFHRARKPRNDKREVEESGKFFTIGVTRRKKVFFCDIDADNIDIYSTKDGFHIVSELAHSFDYRFGRLRVAPKYDANGRKVSPAPKLVFCSCPRGEHVDKRVSGKLELYATSTT